MNHRFNFQIKHLKASLWLIWCIRFVCLFQTPVMDQTESRYSEIARKMLELGNWVTPFHDYGVPFWGKPPLAIWSSALSMKLLGVSEWSERLPHFIFGILIVVLLFLWVKRLIDSHHAWLTIALLSSFLPFYVATGAVMTDICLLLTITIAMISFYQCITANNRYWGFGFFIALGIGLLAKGPIMVVLTVMPCFIWLLLAGQLRRLKQLPWLLGPIITLVISVPWYLLAEYKTPGFLNYFLIGEHLYRFLVPGWQGDLYGFAHQHALGSIWIYAIVSLLPISLIGIAYLSLYRIPIKQWLTTKASLEGFLFAWFLSPLLFFTFSKNIIWPYLLPILPPLAVLISQILIKRQVRIKFIISQALLWPIIILVLWVILLLCPDKSPSTHKSIATKIHQRWPQHRIYLCQPNHFSWAFYSEGMINPFFCPKDKSVKLKQFKYPLLLMIRTADLQTYPLKNKIKCQSISFDQNYYLCEYHSIEK
ncbi:glycosyltransferase family 39 protein [Gammaproteobacteria bacterium]|nr:glycosyltransferase family 39 protein [Gammaproteobacteria bacterium]